MGDADSAKLLEKIYRDEIGHVAYGLKWFRRWKNPGESDWEAFCRTLKFPLSPQRAKGFSLNVAGRQRRRTSIRNSSPRSTSIRSPKAARRAYLFSIRSPKAASPKGKTFNPTKHQAQLARDLENLPQFLCRQDDIVLVRQKPSVEFLSGIKQAGFPLPEFVRTRSIEISRASLSANSPPQARPPASVGVGAGQL